MVAILIELPVRITDAVASVTNQMLENTWHETEHRLELVQAANGAHVGTVWAVRSDTPNCFLISLVFCFCSVMNEFSHPVLHGPLQEL
jgi:hypothetical protein